jgi:hypothetical protein
LDRVNWLEIEKKESHKVAQGLERRKGEVCKIHIVVRKKKTTEEVQQGKV